MPTLIQRVAKSQRNAAAWKVWINLAQLIVIVAIQVLAALALDGWLSIALWVLVARNVILGLLGLGGLFAIAAEAQNTAEWEARQ